MRQTGWSLARSASKILGSGNLADPSADRESKRKSLIGVQNGQRQRIRGQRTVFPDPSSILAAAAFLTTTAVLIQWRGGPVPVALFIRNSPGSRTTVALVRRASAGRKASRGTNRAPLQRYPRPPVAAGDPGSNRTPPREMTPRCRFAHPAPAACRSALGKSCGRPPRSISSQSRYRIPLLNAAKPLRLGMAKGNGIYIVADRSRLFAIPRTQQFPVNAHLRAGGR